MASKSHQHCPLGYCSGSALWLFTSLVAYFSLAAASDNSTADHQHLIKPTIHPSEPSTSNLGLRAVSQISREIFESRIEPRTFESGIGDSWNELHYINITGWLTLWEDSQSTKQKSSNDNSKPDNIIRLLSCDSPSKDFNITERFLNATADKPYAVVLYSLVQDECLFAGEDEENYYSALYTMTWKSVSKVFVDALKKPENKFMSAVIAYNFTSEQETTNHTHASNRDDNSQNILGPAPTTAVAMIILYSITGVVTFLFLTVITVGALRAHRHPERYGPRPGNFGLPRQTRAQGIARAMLDTIPLVRFRGGQNNEDTENGAKPEEMEIPETASGNTMPDDAAVATTGAVSRSGNNNADESTNDGKRDADTPATAVAAAASTKDGGATDANRPGNERAPGSSAANSTSAEKPTNAEKNPEAVPEMLPSHLICPICMESFVEGEQLRVLPCRHPFHPDCVDPWLLNVAGSCPVCRIDLHPALAEQESAQQSSSEPAVVDRNAPALRSSRFARYREILLHPVSNIAEREQALRQLQGSNIEHEQRRRSRGGSEIPPPTAESTEAGQGGHHQPPQQQHEQNETEAAPIPNNRLSFFSRRRTSWLTQNAASSNSTPRPPLNRNNTSGSGGSH